MWRQYLRSHPRFSVWYERLDRSPGWVNRIAVTAAVLTVVLPLVLLALAALVVGVIVFTLLSIVARLLALLAGGGAAVPDGRVNVRVVRRDDR